MNADGPDFGGLFDRAAATYDIAAFPFFTPFGEALVEFARISPADRVLDVGCGAGAALAPAARLAASAVGVELSPVMAERARAAAPGAEILVGDASSLDFADDAFDLVLSAFTVFFMPDPTAALREWRRVLAPGGRIALSTWLQGDPRWSWENEVRKQFRDEIRPDALQQLASGMQILERFETAAGVAHELEAAGFAVDEQREHAIEFVFPDERAWWDWNWSHGTRMFLERLSDDAVERFRERAFEAMQASRDGDGFPRRYRALLSRALVP